jgi:hypothetical protein
MSVPSEWQEKPIVASIACAICGSDAITNQDKAREEETLQKNTKLEGE